MTQRSARAWITAALVAALAACASAVPAPAPRAPADDARSAPAAGVVDSSSYGVGSNLPRWAACLFPRRANPGALRRAQPCPSETRVTRTYQVAEIAGCWAIRSDYSPNDDGKDWLTRAPVRLMPRPARYPADAKILPVKLGPSASGGDDVAGYDVGWEFSPPDEISFSGGDGFSVVTARFRVRGDTLVGMVQAFTDVMIARHDTVPDWAGRMSGVRVPCPPLADKSAARLPPRSHSAPPRT